MTNDLENKLVTMLDAIQNGAVEIGGAMVKYSPDIADALLTVVRLDCVASIFYPAVWLLLLSVCGLFLSKHWNASWEASDGAINIVALIFLLIGFVIAGLFFLNFWSWVGVFEPKLYVAHMLVKKVMK